MNAKADKIKEIAKGLLADGKVDVVMGYKAATVPLNCAPYFARTEGEVDELTWDGNCRINLATFLPRRSDKVAIVAAGCHARNAVGQVVEKQIPRENVFIIGVPCDGMIDPVVIRNEVEGEITGAEETDSEVIVSGDGFEKTFDRAEVLMRNCKLCVHRNPPVYDELAGAEVGEQDGVDRFADIVDIEQMSAADKAAYFDQIFSTCIRCYACRNACPLCYCQTCFVDEHLPQWLGKSVSGDGDVLNFHLLRAFHCAGRCTDCGACEAACPMNIKLRQLTRKLEKDIEELYGYEAGMSLEAQPPMAVYRMDDYEAFIK